MAARFHMSPDHSFPARIAVSRRRFLHGAALIAVCAPASALQPRRLAARESPHPLSVSEIAPGVFVYSGRHEPATAENLGGVSNAGFVIGDTAVAVIDTGGSYGFGNALRDAIKSRTDLPIRYVINTHMHPDHVLGNAAFEIDQPAFIAHHKMGRGLAARAERYLAVAEEELGADAFSGTRIVPPTHNVETQEVIDLGGRRLRLDPQPTAHTDNDLIVFDDLTRTLFLGDLLFVGHVPALDGSIRGWLSVIASLSKVEAARAVPGHGPASVPWPAAITSEQRYLEAIATDVRAMIAKGGTLSEAMETAALSERDAWELFDDYHARNVSAAFAELEWE